MKILSLFTIFILLNGCSIIAQPNPTKYKWKKTYHYVIDNKNYKSFGYMVSKEDGLITAPNSILIDDSFIYIVDPFHYNIKKINYFSGVVSIIALPKEDANSIPDIIDIFKFNNQFYILRLDEYVDLISNEGAFIKRLKLPSREDNVRYYGEKFITNQTETFFTIQLDVDQKQNPDYTIVKYFTNVYIDGTVTRDSTTVKEYKYDKETHIRSKEISIESQNGRYSLITQNGTYLIDFKPKLRYWENNVVDFFNNLVATYHCDGKMVRVDVYTY